MQDTVQNILTLVSGLCFCSQSLQSVVVQSISQSSTVLDSRMRSTVLYSTALYCTAQFCYCTACVLPYRYETFISARHVIDDVITGQLSRIPVSIIWGCIFGLLDLFLTIFYIYRLYD